MSWFKRAENFLNDLDQSAASVLKGSNESLTNKPRRLGSDADDSQVVSGEIPRVSSTQSLPGRDSSKTGSGGAAERQTLSPPRSSARLAGRGTTTSRHVPKNIPDDLLFEYLNSNDSRGSAVNGSGHGNVEKTSDDRLTPTAANRDDDDGAAGGSGHDGDGDDVGSLLSMSRTRDSSPASSVGEMLQQDKDADPSTASTTSSTSQAVLLENRLLRRKMDALNTEIKTYAKRQNNMMDQLRQQTEQAKQTARQLLESDKLVRQMRDQADDLRESLNAKDSQLSVLRVRFEEQQRQLEEAAAVERQLRADSERLQNNFGQSSGLQADIIGQLNGRIHELEANNESLQASKEALQLELCNSNSSLRNHQNDVTRQLEKCKEELQNERRRNNELQTQVQLASRATESIRLELSEYREKAARILQSKERLIASLSSTTSVSAGAGAGAHLQADGHHTDPPVDHMAQVELKAVRDERDRLVGELGRAGAHIDRLSAELQTAETQARDDADNSLQTLRTVEGQLSDERRQREAMEAELELSRSQAEAARAQLAQLRLTHLDQLQQRDQELARLRQTQPKPRGRDLNEIEQENRIRGLTDNLIEKQSLIEALTSEKNGLLLQLERLERAQRSAAGTALAIDVHDEDVRQRPVGNSWTVRSELLQESAFDSPVTRQVKQAANAVDVCSIRAGSMLRRNPLARVFLVVYMIVLHGWVFFLLLTYQPEAHGLDYHPQPPAVGP